jgi:hypothetical protein
MAKLSKAQEQLIVAIYTDTWEWTSSYINTERSLWRKGLMANGKLTEQGEQVAKSILEDSLSTLDDDRAEIHERLQGAECDNLELVSEYRKLTEQADRIYQQLYG